VIEAVKSGHGRRRRGGEKGGERCLIGLSAKTEAASSLSSEGFSDSCMGLWRLQECNVEVDSDWNDVI
jgi:hypothetical protein